MKPARLLNCKKEHSQMWQDPRVRQRLSLRVADAQYVGAHALIIIPRRACAQGRLSNLLPLPWPWM